jgi:hypothetical protein
VVPANTLGKFRQVPPGRTFPLQRGRRPVDNGNARDDHEGDDVQTPRTGHVRLAGSHARIPALIRCRRPCTCTIGFPVPGTKRRRLAAPAGLSNPLIPPGMSGGRADDAGINLPVLAMPTHATPTSSECISGGGPFPLRPDNGRPKGGRWPLTRRKGGLGWVRVRARTLDRAPTRSLRRTAGRAWPAPLR